jgi:uncharacterized repeat protein (TIGR03809 family)
MSERQAGPYLTVARKWLALVERRQENFIELCDTGRWRHYYTQTEFLEEMRKVLRLRDRWASIAGVPLSDEIFDENFLARPRPSPPAKLPVTPWQSGFNGV